MSVDDTWYLQMVGTDPEYQGRGVFSTFEPNQMVFHVNPHINISSIFEGLMSLLVRDAFAYDPQSTFTLEATTAKSRDQYKHLGFEACCMDY